MPFCATSSLRFSYVPTPNILAHLVQERLDWCNKELNRVGDEFLAQCFQLIVHSLLGVNQVFLDLQCALLKAVCASLYVQTTYSQVLHIGNMDTTKSSMQRTFSIPLHGHHKAVRLSQGVFRLTTCSAALAAVCAAHSSQCLSAAFGMLRFSTVTWMHVT